MKNLTMVILLSVALGFLTQANASENINKDVYEIPENIQVIVLDIMNIKIEVPTK